MKETTTTGTICFKDDFGIVYKISKITYTEHADETFEYVFTPFYEVIDMLNADLFQGIPGLKLETHKKQYVRTNVIPTFIAERTPGKNRENLWELLETVGMTYLNQLEWLIRTDTTYSGDRLYVKRYEPADEKQLIKTNAVSRTILKSCRYLLDAICYGNDVESPEYTINDSNRKDIYHILYQLYANECKRVNANKRAGIRKGAEAGHYKGRKRKYANTPKMYDICDAFAKKKITEKEALDALGISRATFYRRLKALRQ